jgi:tRNA threonylcarbamoyladenosine biosynthesis protein TsaB
MAKILLIETATEVCSAAMAVDGKVVALAEDSEQPNHAARLTLLIQDCTQRSGIPLTHLDAVAVSSGPGSYTSLRAGASVAKGICYALDKPLIAVDTLQALAAASQLAAHIPSTEVACFVPMLDARRQEVWTAAYDAQLRTLVPAQPLIFENNFFEIYLQRISETAPANVFVVSGNGAKKIPNDPKIEKVVASLVQSCSAAHLAALAEHFFQNADFQDVAYFEPFYMKPPNITTSSKTSF